tara:strand:- start:1761 stop:1931 length:171 start_codon:yes stop_codon:yes gene_type:complete
MSFQQMSENTANPMNPMSASKQSKHSLVLRGQAQSATSGDKKSDKISKKNSIMMPT